MKRCMARIEIDKHSGYCFGVVKASQGREQLTAKKNLAVQRYRAQ